MNATGGPEIRPLKPRFPLQTERLSLRPLTLADTDALVSYRSIPDVCRYVPFTPMDAAEVRTRIGGPWSRTTLVDPGQALTLGVTLTGTGELVGDVVLFWHSRENAAGELGWVLHPHHSGNGYATEAAAELLRLAFDEMGLHRMVARVDERNPASVAVCARLGMRQEARLVENEWFKGEWTTELDFAVLSDEWTARGR